MLEKEGQVRIPAGCAISGFISRDGNRICGDKIVKSISYMHDRSNGLGGGFAGYGIYPEYKDQYAFHIFYDSNEARVETERFLDKHFDVVNLSRIPTRKHPNITNEAVGYPEDVGKFYRLEEYAGYAWTAHGRYPTNTPGWWGGAHPFALLDYTIVHNGEISSYDANRRYIEMYGYKCNLLTDTEVITYIIDFLNRKQKLCLEDIAKIIAAPFWSEIDSDKYFRNVFSSLLITGPFSIILGFDGGLMALNDRLKLRSMVAAEKGDMVYLASEECAIRAICPVVDRIWSPRGGEPIIVKLNEKK